MSEETGAAMAPAQTSAPGGSGDMTVRREGAVAAGALALGAAALGAIALGALAVGAVAVGKLAIGRLNLGQAKLRGGRVDELRIARLTIGELHLEQVQAPGKPGGSQARRQSRDRDGGVSRTGCSEDVSGFP
jgi:hypothetical protein